MSRFPRCPVVVAVIVGGIFLGLPAPAAAESAAPSQPPVTVSVPPLAGEDTEVSFALKSAKPAANFEPSVGAKLPKALTAHALPRPLIYQMPILKRYTYVKLKKQIVLVNPMTREVVDVFPES